MRKKNDSRQAIGRSSGGLTTKIHALCDALGNPIAFHLSAGHAHDLEEADVLLDKVNADERIIQKLQFKQCQPVIPSKCNRKIKRTFDKYLYKARHLIGNFFAKLKQ